MDYFCPACQQKMKPIHYCPVMFEDKLGAPCESVTVPALGEREQATLDNLQTWLRNSARTAGPLGG